MRTIILIIVLAAAAAQVFGAGSKEPDILVDTEWVAENLDQITLLETARDEDLEVYREGHIPGAVYIDRSHYYGQLGDIPGMFADPAGFIEFLNEIGVRNDKTVVVYDDDRGLWAGRLFWTLEYLGHEKVKFLDGGLAKWKAEGRPLEVGDAPIVEQGDFTASYRDELLVDGDWIHENLDNEQLELVDTRTIEEYTGENIRYNTRGGHIPTSERIEWTLTLTDEEPHVFLPVEELRELYESYDVVNGDRVVTICQTGIRASHSYVVFRLLGYENIAVYDGSWAEWQSDEKFPIVNTAL